MAVLLELPRLLKLRRELIAVVAENLLKSEPLMKSEPWWTRTTDPFIKSELLYQLS